MIRRNISIDESTDAILKRFPNASQYIERAVQDRYTRYTEARIIIREAGITLDEMGALLDLLNGILLPDEMPYSTTLPIEMEDRAELNSFHEEHDISRERWDLITQMAAQRESLARAIVYIADEYWQGGLRDLSWLSNAADNESVGA